MGLTGARANALPAIEAAFAFLVDGHGFSLMQTSDIPSSALYCCDERAVSVGYDFLGDAAVIVRLQERALGDEFDLVDLLGFTDASVRRVPGIREPEAVAAELASFAGLVADRCRDFLDGDLPAFYRTHREALLVQRCRETALEEFYRGDPRRSVRLFACLREYWTPVDREHYDRARSGDGLHLLRLRR